METPAGDDRLSELPDCVLANNILSRLTSRQAARTSVLSRRWRHLWRAVPCVDIDHREFRASEAIDVHAAENERVRLSVKESEAFEDLGDRLLPLLDAPPPPLDALRLRVSYLDFSSTGRRFTRRGLARRPVEFHLSCDNDVIRCPRTRSDRFPNFPGLTLPRHLGAFAYRLTTVRLAGLALDDDFADCLAKDFPVLEDLQLEGCSCFRGYMPPNDVLAIGAPRVASLRIDCPPPAPPVTVVGGMPDLVAASLRDPAGEIGLLRSLCHARRLDLTAFSTTALLLGGDDDSGDFPVFGNLRTLLMYRCDVGVGCQALRRFLRSAPSLEALTLCYCSCSGDSSRSRKRKARSGEKAFDHDYWCIRTACECMSLKSIELEFYEGRAIDELAQALVHVAKEEPRSI
ncbi:unnamed protein product [Urochloa decumbens]|uniref:F-box domain-containing protein n=1 Tax=Urochloa decumbens TaxID=240449 RepID=A0ABC9F2Z1_9POAL